MRRSPLLALPLMIAALFVGSPADAQSRIYIPCPSGAPCSVLVPGYIDAVGTARLPWVVQVAVPDGFCLWPSFGTHDAMPLRTVIAPNGIVYRRDNAVTLQVAPTIAGWYTLHYDTLPPGREQIFQINLRLLPAADCFPTPGR
jgi:hypothetical protein